MGHLGIAKKKPLRLVGEYLGMAIGAFLGALAIRVFLYPNQLIDGGVVGISLILGRLTDDRFISLYLLLLNIPFVYLAYRFIRRTFVIQMLVATVFFAFSLAGLRSFPPLRETPLKSLFLAEPSLALELA